MGPCFGGYPFRAASKGNQGKRLVRGVPYFPKPFMLYLELDLAELADPNLKAGSFLGEFGAKWGPPTAGWCHFSLNTYSFASKDTCDDAVPGFPWAKLPQFFSQSPG